MQATSRFALRDLLFALIMIGMLGLIAELFLQEHTESWQQWIPLIALSIGVVVAAMLRARPNQGTLALFRIIMASFVLAGLIGVYLHYAGNVEFAIERTPELSGLALVWKALRGATPALAPASLAQLGLLGLVYAYAFPTRSRSSINGEMK